MALSLADLKLHCNVTGDDDDAVLTRCLAAAVAHVERMLGYALAEIDGGAPADLEQAALMMGAHYYENREATIVGVSAMPVPLGVADILAEHRTYTFGLADAEDESDG